MSKYTGSTTIIDDQGNVVFERELLPDEIIEEVLRGMPPLNVGNIGSVMRQTKKNIEDANQPPAKRHYKKRESKETTAQAEKRVMGDPAFTNRKGKECCGSTGTRHFKWCTESGGTGDPGLVAVKGGRIPFSESTYIAVRKMYADGMSTDVIVAEKGFDVDECRKIRLSSTYDAYRRA